MTINFRRGPAGWSATVTVGGATHDLGRHATASIAMNAAMQHYYALETAAAPRRVPKPKNAKPKKAR